MKEPSIAVLKRYLSALSKIKAKYVTSERLSRVVGVYPDVINDTLSFFEPMIMMDPSVNLLELVPMIKEFIIQKEENKHKVSVRIEPVVTKKQVEEYESVGDFIYKKFSVGGIIDKNAELSNSDLKILKRLVSEEQARRKGKK